jgi:rhomboid protease GlpG
VRMRQIGTLEDARAAQAFADYLLTLGITTNVDESSERVIVWVHREDQVPRAKEELERFRAEPMDARYHEASREARAIRKHAEDQERRHVRNTIDLGERLGNPLIAGPVTRIVAIICITTYLLSWLGPRFGGPPVYDWLYFSQWIPLENGAAASDGIQAIKHGQFWRAFTPIFIHFSPLHLVFNLYMWMQLGRILEARLGTLTYLLLVLSVALVSNFAQAAYPDAFTMNAVRGGPAKFGGLSGVVYGLIGFALARGRLDPASGLRLASNFVSFALIWLVICTIGLVGPIANTAHVAGLMAGMAGALVALPAPPWQKS